MKLSLEMKSSQLDSAKERLTELEQQLMKRDETITLQKRMLKTVKEEHKEQFNVSIFFCGAHNLSVSHKGHRGHVEIMSRSSGERGSGIV